MGPRGIALSFLFAGFAACGGAATPPAGPGVHPGVEASASSPISSPPAPGDPTPAASGSGPEGEGQSVGSSSSVAPSGTPAPSASADVFASLDGHGLTGGQQLGGGPGSGFGTGRGRAGSAGTATGGDGDLSGSGTGESTPPPERLGALSGEQIRAVVRRSTAFRRCYAAGLERRPSLSGQVAVEFVIGPDGSVARARARSTDLPDGEVVECIVRAFRELRFPRPTRGSVTVVYPLTFTPA